MFAYSLLVVNGHFEPFRAIGSIRNEFAASISSSLSPPSPSGPQNPIKNNVFVCCFYSVSMFFCEIWLPT